MLIIMNDEMSIKKIKKRMKRTQCFNNDLNETYKSSSHDYL